MRLCSIWIAVPILCAMGMAEESGGHGTNGNQTAKAQELIRQLGHESYLARAMAFEQILELGRAALEPLREAMESDDPEIAVRAQKLLVVMRGRGFMGVMLREVPHGADPPEAWVPETDDAPKDRTAGRAFAPAPDVVAIEVVERQPGTPMPAARAGLKPGDRFISVNGRPIYGMIALLREVSLAGPGTRVMIVVEREGRKISLTCDLTCNPSDNPPIELSPEREERQAEEERNLEGEEDPEPGEK